MESSLFSYPTNTSNSKAFLFFIFLCHFMIVFSNSQRVAIYIFI
ncbi:hypothetical protein PLG01_01885 [Streptococcus mutans PKUSS-LG01]|nr:hypothetical protein PLG01_01885 [Streptococcus mutans PKUSS-LG01]